MGHAINIETLVMFMCTDKYHQKHRNDLINMIQKHEVLSNTSQNMYVRMLIEQYCIKRHTCCMTPLKMTN